MIRKEKSKEWILIFIMAVTIAVVTGFPYLNRGITGHLGDMLYHMQRIESVKAALLSGQYPARVNPSFFYGYGYGSSLFYPDVFLLVPALLRILGISPLVTWKLFVVMIAFVGSVMTYFSLHSICRSRIYAMAGTFLLMLSQFYLADVIDRAGLSEYIACMFFPVLAAGIFDFFAGEGRKTYLIGIAFVGMLLSHTIMTVVGLVFTVLVFLSMLAFRSKRKVFLDKARMRRLIVTAVLSVLAVSYYIFPMLEQIMNDRFWFQEPWANIGDFTQPVSAFFQPTGYFEYIAYVGVGIPILILLPGRVLMRKPQEKWADYFLGAGIGLLMGMTNLLPWKLLTHTFFNMLQFTYRFYPVALCCICVGLSLYLKEKCQENARSVVLFIAAVSVLSGIWQNVAVTSDTDRWAVDEELVRTGTIYVGQAEWLPEKVQWEVRAGEREYIVLGSDERLELISEGYNRNYFIKEKEAADRYLLPLVYYKGYSAKLICGDGTAITLETSQSEEGLVQIDVGEGMRGTVRVAYTGTTVQLLSNLVSAVTLAGILLYGPVRKIRKKRLTFE